MAKNKGGNNSSDMQITNDSAEMSNMQAQNKSGGKKNGGKKGGGQTGK